MAEPATIAFATSTSEAALPRAMESMEGFGVPRAVLVVLLATAATFHLPTEPIFIILGVDALVDMARTSVNVTGNCLASAVIARWEGELDTSVLGKLETL